MYDRDEYEYDVPGRRHRDTRQGGRRTGYSNTDPDYNPDDYDWRDRREFSGGNRPNWDAPGSRWEGNRSEGGTYRRDDFRMRSDERMDMPYGEQGEYYNRGIGSYDPRHDDDRDRRDMRGGRRRGYGGGGGRRDIERADEEMSMRGQGRRGYRHGRDMDTNPRTGGWQRDDRDWRDDDHERYETSWRGGVRGGGNWRNDQGMSRGRVGGPDAQMGGYGQRDFRGFGPQGYQRSAARIREDICELLTDAPHIDPSNISIEVDDNGHVTLSGEVESRRDKRAIEDCIDRVRGVRDIANQLTIDFSRRGRGRMSASQSGEEAGVRSGTAQGKRTNGSSKSKSSKSTGKSSKSKASSSGDTLKD